MRRHTHRILVASATLIALASLDESGSAGRFLERVARGDSGLSLQPVTPQIARQLNLNSDSGLVVTDIDPAGPAAEAGLARGDVILEMNKQAVTSVDDVRSALDKAGPRPVLMLIARQGRTIYLTVRAG